MCGIVAYLGRSQAFPILIKGLHRLEYRGYDSAGIALYNAELKLQKCKGKVADLKDHVRNCDLSGTVGIGHTRWATHGEPNDVNAHPHLSNSGKLAIIHNGIIENYDSLKKQLLKRGYHFSSETDTEILINLIEEILKIGDISLSEAVRLALHQVIGAYAIVVMSVEEPNTLIAAKKGSPLVIGVGTDEYFIASDATPLIDHTRNVIYLEDEEVATINKEKGLKVVNIKNKKKTPDIKELEMHLDQLEKGGFEHFMLKEIFEQPRSIRDSMRGRLRLNRGIIQLGGIKEYEEKFLQAKRIIIVACGTSWHAGLVGEYLFEDMARIPVEVEYASEFRYRNPIINENDLVIAISQSGETADTLAAIQLAKSKGATILGICNVVGSSIPRATDAGSYTHAGPEIGVASTKAFTAQVTVLALMALRIAKKKGSINKTEYQRIISELHSIPEIIDQVLQNAPLIEEIAQRFYKARNFLYLGRGYNFPVALEGALKLKEISYIHAEGYPAAEMKHGPIALIDKKMPVVFIATQAASYDKVVSNIQEVKARKGVVIAVVSKGDNTVNALSDHIIEIPVVEECLSPLVSVVPLQLLSYYIAVKRGCHVDQPRNLAKSVTVE